MACPYFRPTKALSWLNWRGKLRPPLGEVYAGECAACEDDAFRPAEDLLQSCNLGYASGECARFPKSEGPDAVRFAVSSDQDGVVRIAYSYEQGHLPCGHGVIEYRSLASQWRGVEGGSLLHRQAEAYLESYLRWKENDRRVRPDKKSRNRREARGQPAARRRP